MRGEIMFEAQLKSDLESIFKFKLGATYQTPSDAQEQEKLFIQIDLSRNNVREKLMSSRVEGRLLVYANADKFPHGYFEKCIAEAPSELSRKFFFYDITGNSGTYQNIAERTASFYYFYSGQYDPNKGTINEVTIQCGGDT